MPPPSPNFKKAVLDSDKTLRLTGQTGLPTDVIAVNTTVIFKSGQALNAYDKKDVGAAWSAKFKTLQKHKLAIDDEIYVVGTLIREKQSEDCSCPEPDNVVWDQYLKVKDR